MPVFIIEYGGSIARRDTRLRHFLMLQQERAGGGGGGVSWEILGATGKVGGGAEAIRRRRLTPGTNQVLFLLDTIEEGNDLIAYFGEKRVQGEGGIAGRNLWDEGGGFVLGICE